MQFLRNEKRKNERNEESKFEKAWIKTEANQNNRKMKNTFNVYQKPMFSMHVVQFFNKNSFSSVVCWENCRTDNIVQLMFDEAITFFFFFPSLSSYSFFLFFRPIQFALHYIDHHEIDLCTFELKTWSVHINEYHIHVIVDGIDWLWLVFDKSKLNCKKWFDGKRTRGNGSFILLNCLHLFHSPLSLSLFRCSLSIFTIHLTQQY